MVKTFKNIKLGDKVINADIAVYEWLDNYRTTPIGKVSFSDALHNLIDEYNKLRHNINNVSKEN